MCVDVSSGPLCDYTRQAECRAAFLEAAILAFSETPGGGLLPNPAVFEGFYLCALDLTMLLQAINRRIDQEP